MRTQWTWSYASSWLVLVLFGAFFIGWNELPQFYSPFLHGLVTGISAALLLAAVYDRSRSGVILGGLGLWSMAMMGPTDHPPVAWMAHTLSLLTAMGVSLRLTLWRRFYPAPSRA